MKKTNFNLILVAILFSLTAHSKASKKLHDTLIPQAQKESSIPCYSGYMDRFVEIMKPLENQQQEFINFHTDFFSILNDSFTTGNHLPYEIEEGYYNHIIEQVHNKSFENQYKKQIQTANEIITQVNTCSQGYYTTNINIKNAKKGTKNYFLNCILERSEVIYQISQLLLEAKMDVITEDIKQLNNYNNYLPLFNKPLSTETLSHNSLMLSERMNTLELLSGQKDGPIRDLYQKMTRLSNEVNLCTELYFSPIN